jgi:GTPase
MTEKFGAISLIGPTNAGKSTLLNKMLREKLAITSRKVQTTRFRIRGVAMHGGAIAFETPLFFHRPL